MWISLLTLANAADPIVGVDVVVHEDGPDAGFQHGDPVVTRNGSAYTILWEDSHGATAPDLRGIAVDATGAPIGSPASVVRVESEQRLPDVALGDSGPYGVWTDQSGLWGSLLAADGGAPTGVKLLYDSTDNWGWPAITAGDDGLAVVWVDDPGLSLLRIEDGGAPVDAGPIIIYDSIYLPTFPAMASDGERYLVTWLEDDGRDFPILAARVRESDGVVLDPVPVIIGYGDASSAPSVAWNGSWFLVAWAHSGVIGQHVGADLSLPPSGTVSIRTGAGQEPDVAAWSEGFLVVYAETREGNDVGITWGSYGVYGMRINAAFDLVDKGDGAPGSGGFEIANDPARLQWNPSVSGVDGHYFVAWEDSEDRGPTSSDPGIHGATVTLDPEGSGDTDIDTDTDADTDTDTAADTDTDTDVDSAAGAGVGTDDDADPATCGGCATTIGPGGWALIVATALAWWRRISSATRSSIRCQLGRAAGRRVNARSGSQPSR